MADAFTICDNYFCSVIGPTDPNRLYGMAASIDPDGKNGGPLLQTLSTNRLGFFGRLTYTTTPEQLQARGITWKCTRLRIRPLGPSSAKTTSPRFSRP